MWGWFAISEYPCPKFWKVANESWFAERRWAEEAELQADRLLLEVTDLRRRAVDENWISR